MEKEGKISFKAIIIGFIISSGGAVLVISIVAIIMAFFSVKQAVTKLDEYVEYVNNILKSFEAFRSLLVITRWGLTFLGGWITGKIAKKAKILNATIMGSIGFLFNLVITVNNPFGYTCYNLLVFTLFIPAAILGGYVAYKNK
jgi:hypothetical protein